MGKRKRFVKRQMGVLLALLVLSNSMLVYAEEPTTVTVAEDETYSEATDSNVVVEAGGEITGGTHTVGAGETVTVEAGGTISDGTFEGEDAGGTGTGKVENSGTISGGDFTVPVEVTEQGRIEGGEFTGTEETVNVTNQGTIAGGTFLEKVVNYGEIIGGIFQNIVENYGTISGGTFEAIVNNENSGMISGGTFKNASTINNKSGGTISAGTFKGAVYNDGTISGGTYRNEGHSGAHGAILDNGSASGATTGTITGGTFQNKLISNHAGSTMSNVTIRGGNVRNTGEIENSRFDSWVTIYLLEELNQTGDEVVGVGKISDSSIRGSIYTAYENISIPNTRGTVAAVIEGGSITNASIENIKGITFDHVTIDSLSGNDQLSQAESVTFKVCTISDPELLEQLQALGNVVIIEQSEEPFEDNEQSTGNGTGNPAGSVADSASGSTEAGTGGELSYHIESSSSNASAMEATARNSSSQTNPMELYRQKLFAPQTKLTKTVVFDNLYARGYSLALMQLIKEHNELSYTFKMKYQGHVYTITIPAGYEWDVDEDITWYGPLKLYEMFGGYIEQ